jgi:hypothetical protein
MTKFLSKLLLPNLVFMGILGIQAAFADEGYRAALRTADTDWKTSTADFIGPREIPEQFDKQKWRQWRDSIDTNVRLKERWDLFHSYPLLGMKRQQVIDLLGLPEQSKSDSRDVDYIHSPGRVEINPFSIWN